MSMPEYQVVKVKHEFTDDELKEIADEIVEKLLAVAVLDEEKKDFDKSQNERIKGIDSIITILSNKYSDGYESENRNCELRRNYTNKTIEYVDPQSGEVVKERPMTTEEQQMRLMEGVTVTAEAKR